MKCLQERELASSSWFGPGPGHGVTTFNLARSSRLLLLQVYGEIPASVSAVDEESRRAESIPSKFLCL